MTGRTPPPDDDRLRDFIVERSAAAALDGATVALACLSGLCQVLIDRAQLRTEDRDAALEYAAEFMSTLRQTRDDPMDDQSPELFDAVARQVLGLAR